MALRSLRKYALLINIFVSLGSITYGYFSSTIATTLGQPGFYSFMNLAPDATSPGYGHTTHVIATVNGLYSAGGAVGCLLFMWLAEKFGRLRTIQLGALIAILGGALQGGAANIDMFYAGRIIAGMPIGMLVSCTPLYLSELSASAAYGRQVGVHAIFLVLGYFMASWVGYGCYFATPVNSSFAWRFPLCLQTLPPLLLLLGSPWIPESVRWLLKHDRAEEAWKTLQRIHAHSHFAKEEFHQMTQQIKLEEEQTREHGAIVLNLGRRWEVFWSSTTTLCWCIKVSVKPAQLLSCFSSLDYHCRTNLQSSWSLASRQGQFSSGMYLTGNCGQIITITILTTLTAQYAGTENKVGNGFTVFMIFLYLAFQGTFCDTTMYLYVSEIFPYEMRTIGIGFSLFGQFAGTLIVVQSAPIAFAAVGWKFHLLFILRLLVYSPLIYWYMPETTRFTLEEIGEKFGDEVAVKIIDAAGANQESRKVLYEKLEHHEVLQRSDKETVGS
ncbi:hypothetical protein IFR05_011141 [Cadophora sp. M221]|nr:hypothetical protein IFR05_011141 [Cadophora sp. M221]